MAEPHSFSGESSIILSEDHVLCSICLDVFTDPVTSPCGHNFCKICLTQHWNQNPQCYCPLCKNNFTKRPELKINTTLREVADQFKKKRSAGSTGRNHKSHRFIPIEENKIKKVDVEKAQIEVKQMICDRLKKIDEIKLSVNQSKRNREREKSESVKFFRTLIGSIERSQAELLEVMEENQKAAEKQAEGFIKDLQQEITELKRRETDLDQLLHSEDHLNLLQIHPSIYRPPPTKNWSEISINTDLNVENVRRSLSQLQESLNKLLDEKLKETVSTDLKRIHQFAVDVTLDPDTANPYLILSDDGKEVKHGNRKQNLPDTPKRFTSHSNVLGKQSFSSGRFYYEVLVGKKTKWDLGVCGESVNRKGLIKLKPQSGFWVVGLRNEDQYYACADPSVLLSLREKPQKVGVFVDYKEGLISFYDVENRSHIYSFTAQSFTGRLCLFFSPCNNDGGKNSAPLIISPVIKTE